MNLEEQQQAIKANTATLALYHFETCPYCIRVRRVMEQLGLEMELRDIHKNRQHHQDLVQGGGNQMVPCLRIHHSDGTDHWMYESDDIIEFLKARSRGPRGGFSSIWGS